MPDPDVPGGTIVNSAALTYDFEEKQKPGLLLLGWHREWAPGNHTVLLLGRLANEQRVSVDGIGVNILTRLLYTLDPIVLPPELRSRTEPPDAAVFSRLRSFTGQGAIQSVTDAKLNLDYRSDFETYGAELQQIITLGPSVTVVGGRYQRGLFETQARLTDFYAPLPPEPEFDMPPADQHTSVDFERVNLYLYNTFRFTPWLSANLGATYDILDYPQNFRTPPINERQASLSRFSPKAGLTLQPWRGAVVRGAYTEGISGTSFDESVRLEPTQVAGFLQAYRTIISESLIGSVAGSKYRLGGLSFEQKLPSRTYLGVEYNVLHQDIDRTIGVFDQIERSAGRTLATVPSSLLEKNRYREDVLTATVNQLLGEQWALGARYRYTLSKLRQTRPELDNFLDPDVGVADQSALVSSADRVTRSGLHEMSFSGVFNHPSGMFARGEANWYQQQNDDFVKSVAEPPLDAPSDLTPRIRTDNRGLAGDDFWQFNLYAGRRFYRNQCELSLGALNITGQDYRLYSLNPLVDLPRDPTFVIRCKLAF